MIEQVLLCGDSYGNERRINNTFLVPKNKTWPQIVKNLKKNKLEVYVDFKNYRKITEIEDVINNYSQCKKIFIQAGIVDIYPRTLPERFSKSKLWIFRILRKFIRKNRVFWMEHIYSKPYLTINQVINFLLKLVKHKTEKNFYILNIPPILKESELETPGAQKVIRDYNKILKDSFSEIKNVEIIDIAEVFINTGLESLLERKDSHLNIKGNLLVSEIIMEKLNSK